MKNFLKLALATVVMAASLIPSAQALTTTGSVGFVVTVTGSCTVVVTSANATLDYLASPTAGVASAPVDATGTVRCTKGLSYTPSWNALTGTIAGIAYTLTPGGTAVASAQTGDGIANAFTVAPSAIANQVGDCTIVAGVVASASGCTGTVTAGSNTHQMTITY